MASFSDASRPPRFTTTRYAKPTLDRPGDDDDHPHRGAHAARSSTSRRRSRSPTARPSRATTRAATATSCGSTPASRSRSTWRSRSSRTATSSSSRSASSTAAKPGFPRSQFRRPGRRRARRATWKQTRPLQHSWACTKPSSGPKISIVLRHQKTSVFESPRCHVARLPPSRTPPSCAAAGRPPAAASFVAHDFTSAPARARAAPPP